MTKLLLICALMIASVAHAGTRHFVCRDAQPSRLNEMFVINFFGMDYYRNGKIVSTQKFMKPFSYSATSWNEILEGNVLLESQHVEGAYVKDFYARLHYMQNSRVAVKDLNCQRLYQIMGRP